MTREQIIVLGFIAAAFVAGWVTSALIRRRDRARAGGDALAALAEQRVGPAVETPQPPAQTRASANGHGAGPLVDEVSEALRSDAANDSMLSVVRADRGAALTELELDLTDWGFTYGVAWARARQRALRDPDDAVAREALDAAERVFRAYTGEADWTRGIDERRARPADNSGASRPR